MKSVVVWYDWFFGSECHTCTEQKGSDKVGTSDLNVKDMGAYVFVPKE